MSTRGPRFAESAAWTAALGAPFVLVYGGTNVFTSTLDAVPSLYLGWERQLPLLPWMAVPYRSLDRFFVASFLLVEGRGQLRRHAARLAAAITGGRGVTDAIVGQRFDINPEPNEQCGPFRGLARPAHHRPSPSKPTSCQLMGG